MKFARKRTDYEAEYTKTQAKKVLLEDERIASIVNRGNKMIVTTHPFIPKGFPGDKIFIYPVGTYVITLAGGRNNISIKIKRKEGWVQTYYNNPPRWYTPHINKSYGRQYGENGICWGSIEKEMYIMKTHKDWFWIVRKCLELINDFTYSVGDETSTLKIVTYMLDYMKNDEDAQRKIIKMVKNKTYNYISSYGEQRQWLYN